MQSYTCSSRQVISFCICWRAALAAWSWWINLSRDSFSSLSSSSTLPSNCRNREYTWYETWNNLLHRMVPDTRCLRQNKSRQNRKRKLVWHCSIARNRILLPRNKNEISLARETKNNNTYDFNKLQTLNLPFLNLWLGKQQKNQKDRTNPFRHTWHDECQ